MSKLKISFVLPHADLSGGIRVLAIHAAGLARRGHDVYVVSQPRRAVGLRARAKALLRGGGFVSALRLLPPHFHGVDVAHTVLDRARPVCDSDLPEADIVVATWWETAEWVGSLSPSRGVKAHFVQGYEVGDMWPGIPVERSRAVWRLRLHRVAVSQWLCGIARERFGCRQIDLVPNAVDHEQFRAAPRERGTRPTIGFVWSHSGFKGCDVAIGAAVKLREQIADLRCAVFGQTERPTVLPAWIDYHQRPAQSLIPTLYSSADVWLWPSRFEGFGLPLLEAMACRTPVVATPGGAAPELVAQGGGELVPHDDPGAMAAAAAKLLSCPAEEWAAASARAHAVAASYTWERSTELFEQSLYRAVETARAGDRAVAPVQ